MAFWYLQLFFLLSVSGAKATVFTLNNNCRKTIWPGIQPSAGKPDLEAGGFPLKPGETVSISAPAAWSGRFWGRRSCSFDPSGKGSCITGDCGGLLACSGMGGAPPVTLAEFTLNSPDDYYDISLVDGYNMAVSITPSGGSGECKPARCVSDLNQICPTNLQVKRKKRVVACESACMAFNRPEYCCTGDYSSPDKCKPTNYSRVFKAACPSAYSYAYDDQSSLRTCNGANYLIKFC
ncbi:PREDICTED: thaumatin-like protein [Nelumbo nucifera]|uniref:Thaumatin-like protein n=2 Tax=Nelumbo nucifera TaxID=4432 RepID=A0A822ZFQ3_NELNU|nr:PREDICTED: thaumatin-like protein [Nelumbo nucifera]DAD42269.1 TPA_asm: hypothetical protein HUJ06_000499 [Nelumbo nucifera]